MSIFRTACPTPVFCPHNIHRAIQRKIIIIKGNKKKKRKKKERSDRPFRQKVKLQLTTGTLTSNSLLTSGVTDRSCVKKWKVQMSKA